MHVVICTALLTLMVHGLFFGCMHTHSCVYVCIYCVRLLKVSWDIHILTFICVCFIHIHRCPCIYTHIHVCLFHSHSYVSIYMYSHSYVCSSSACTNVWMWYMYICMYCLRSLRGVEWVLSNYAYESRSVYICESPSITRTSMNVCKCIFVCLVPDFEEVLRDFLYTYMSDELYTYMSHQL